MSSGVYVALLTVVFIFLWAAATAPSTNKLTPVYRLEGIKEEDMETMRGRDTMRNGEIMSLHGIPKFTVLGAAPPPNIGGLYYTTIKLGSPPKEFRVQIDTGSNVLWVNCIDCLFGSNGLTRPNLFTLDQSSSVQPVLCNDLTCLTTFSGECTNHTFQSLCAFTKAYSNGRGVFGYYASDLMELDVVMPHNSNMLQNASMRVLFGCNTYNITGENQTIDGILGLGKEHPSPVTQIATQLMIPQVFSHCLGENGDGMLIMGEFNYDASAMVYTPLVPKGRHYNLDLKSISVGGEVLALDPGMFNTSDTRGTFVDSGTFLSYIVHDAYDPLLIEIDSAVIKYQHQRVDVITFEGNNCYKLPISDLKGFPTVAFNFAGNASLFLEPKDYVMIRHRAINDGLPSLLCVAFQRNENDDFTILGNILLKDKIITYDLDRQQLGWSNYYNCSEGKVKASGINVAEPTILKNLCLLMILYQIIF